MQKRTGPRRAAQLAAFRSELQLDVNFTVTADGQAALAFQTKVRQALQDLGLAGQVKIA